MLYLPSYRLNYDLATVLASLAAVNFRVTADMGADGTGWDAQHQGDFGAGLSLLEHRVNGFHVLFFHG